MTGLVRCDGFDAYNGVGANTGVGTKWTSLLSSGIAADATSLVSGRYGGQAMRMTAASTGQNFISARYRGFEAAYTNLAPCFAFRVSNLGQVSGAWPFAAIMSGAAAQWGLRVNQVGQLIVCRQGLFSNGGVDLGSTIPGVVRNNTWHFISLPQTIGASGGAVHLVLDGDEIAVFTGLNNAAAGGTTADGIAFSGAVCVSGLTYDFDDYAEVSGAVDLGEGRAEIIRPASDNTVQFTPSSGANNYSRVNETLVDGDTSYVQDATVGHRDLYTFGALSSTPQAIYGVQAVTFARKTDATTRAIYASVKSGATNEDGPAFYLSTNFNRFEHMMTLDPDTSLAWNAAALAPGVILGGPKIAV